MFTFFSKGSTLAGVVGASVGITSAGAGTSSGTTVAGSEPLPIRPAAAVTTAAQKQYFVHEEQEDILEKYWHKASP